MELAGRMDKVIPDPIDPNILWICSGWNWWCEISELIKIKLH